MKMRVVHLALVAATVVVCALGFGFVQPAAADEGEGKNCHQGDRCTIGNKSGDCGYNVDLRGCACIITGQPDVLHDTCIGPPSNQ